MPGRRFASMDLPVPGAPVKSTLCPPAAAMTMARRASDCPITSAKSGTWDGSGRGEGADALQCLHHLPGGVGWIDGHGVGTGLGCLGGVLCRDVQRPDAVLGSGKRHGQHAGHRAQTAVQCKLAEKGSIGR